MNSLNISGYENSQLVVAKTDFIGYRVSFVDHFGQEKHQFKKGDLFIVTVFNVFSYELVPYKKNGIPALTYENNTWSRYSIKSAQVGFNEVNFNEVTEAIDRVTYVGNEDTSLAERIQKLEATIALKDAQMGKMDKNTESLKKALGRALFHLDNAIRRLVGSGSYDHKGKNEAMLNAVEQTLYARDAIEFELKDDKQDSIPF